MSVCVYISLFFVYIYMHVWIADAAHSASCLAVHTVCLIAQLEKNPVRFLSQEDLLEKG